MAEASNCAVCHSSFGILLWRHQCNFCHRTVCDDCAPKHSGHRQCSACAKGQGTAAEEREKQLRAIQGRMQAAGQRGRPQLVNTASTQQQQQQQQQFQQAQQLERPTDQAMMVASQQEAQATRPPQGSNPVLEAALRRQQQQKEKQVGVYGNSSEKSQLIMEIVSLLHSKGEEEPFGLRAMDETKLRMYLRHIKEKGNGTMR